MGNYIYDEFSDFNENIEGLITEQEKFKIKYAVILNGFVDDYAEFSSFKERLGAMIHYELYDDESLDILNEAIQFLEDTIELYYSTMQNLNITHEFLDSQCKNVDYRIRKGLDLEQKGLSLIKEGFLENNQEKAQLGLDESEKSSKLISSTFDSIFEIVEDSYNI